MIALILAGGFATRLWPLSEHRAKPLLLLNGKSILAHITEKIPRKIPVIILTNKKFEQSIQSEIEKFDHDDIDIFCEDAFSDGQKLGALGALSAVIREKKINDDIAVLAGDNLLTEFEFSDLECEPNTAKLIVRELEDRYEARKFGVVEGIRSKNSVACPPQAWEISVTGFEEKPENPKSNLVSTGFLSFGKDLIPLLHEFAAKEPDALGGIFPHFLNNDVQITAHTVAGDWFDVGSFETYLEAHKAIQSEKIFRGKNVHESKNTFDGKVFIGDNCLIKNCILRNVIIYPGVELQDCIISESVIDENCKLSGLDLNRKLIRSGTDLKN